MFSPSLYDLLYLQLIRFYSHIIFAFCTARFVCFSTSVHWSSLNGTSYKNRPVNLRHMSVTYFFRLYIFQNGVRLYIFFTLTRVRKWRLRFYPVVGRYLSFSRYRQQKQVYTTINNTCCDGWLVLSGYRDRGRHFPHHPETTLVTRPAARLGLVGTINREETWRRERQKRHCTLLKIFLGSLFRTLKRRVYASLSKITLFFS